MNWTSRYLLYKSKSTSFNPNAIYTCISPSLVPTIANPIFVTRPVPPTAASQDTMDTKDVTFNPCESLFPLTSRSELFTLRRTSRTKAQNGKQSKLRISKRSLPGEKARRNVKAVCSDSEVQLTRKAALYHSFTQIIHIATFRTSFDFRSMFPETPKLESSSDLCGSPSTISAEIVTSRPAALPNPIFTLSPVRIILLHGEDLG